MASTLKTIFTIITSLLLVTSYLCSPVHSNESSSIGGTGSEVVGVVNYPDSSEAAKRKEGHASQLPLIGGGVFINPIDYLADTGSASEKAKTYTNAEGFFRIDSVVEGEHILYVRDDKGKAIARRFTVKKDQKRINLGTLFAQKTAAVSINYNGPSTDDVLFFIDLEGTNMQVRCSGGSIGATLDYIPTGTSYTVIVRMFKPIRKESHFPSIELSPGVTHVLDAMTGE